MKSLSLLPLLVFGVHAGPSYTECYSDVDLKGNHVHFENYAPDLYSSGIDNDIESTYQTGVWLYYEHDDYNLVADGKVHFAHGIDISVNFPKDHQNVVSSLRFAGSLMSLNAETFTLYEGTAFTGNEFYTEYNISTLGSLAGKVSSMIITGSSPWTVYTGEGFTGSHLCVYPTGQDVGTNGQVLEFGLYSSIENIGILDNSIMSVRKGCWASPVAEAPELKVDGRQENGAWGRLM